MQEGDQKFKLEKVVFLVKSIDKPIVLENLQEQVTVVFEAEERRLTLTII